MAEIYRSDIVRVDLDHALLRKHVGAILVTGDKLGNRFGAEIFRDGNPVDVTGCGVTAYFMRPGEDAIVLNGTASGSVAYVDLAQACYSKASSFTLTIKISYGGSTTALRVIDGYILLTQTDDLVDPGEVVPTLDDLLAQIEAMEQGTEAARNVVAEYEGKVAEQDASIAALTEEIARTMDGMMKYDFPSGFSWTDNVLKDRIYTDGKGRFVVDYNVKASIPEDGIDVYISPVGDDTNDGLSKTSPKATITGALSVSGVKRIHVLEGTYPRETVSVVNKDVAIIGHGDVVFTSNTEKMVWRATSTPGIYATTRTTTVENGGIFDLTTIDGDFFRRYTWAVFETMDVTQGTYFAQGSTLYVHAYDDIALSQETICHSNGQSCLTFNTAGSNLWICGIKCICGGSHDYARNFEIIGNEENPSNVYVYGCESNYTLRTTDTTGGAGFYAINDTVVFQNCRAYHLAKDGFGYGESKVIEIGCTSAYNGTEGATNANGSSMHTDGKIIRVNCHYHDTIGPVVDDVGQNTESLNIGVVAYHSLLTDAGDFMVEYGNAKMWLDSCVSYSSDKGIVSGGASDQHCIVYKRHCDVEKADTVVSPSEIKTY